MQGQADSDLASALSSGAWSSAVNSFFVWATLHSLWHG